MLWRKKKSEIVKGGIYVFDPENLNKQKEYGIIEVEAMDKVGYDGEGNEVWLVVPTSLDKSIRDPGKNGLRVPAKTLKTLNYPVIRYPANMPFFTDKDLKLLKHLTRVLPRSNDIQVEKSDIDNIENICQKIEFMIHLQEVSEANKEKKDGE